MSLDLAGCAGEPIRIPGAIQPHGWLIVFDSAAAQIVAYSTNCVALTRRDPGAATTSALHTIFESLLPTAASLAPGHPALWIGSVAVEGRELDVTAHSNGTYVLLEVEPASDRQDTQAIIQSVAREFLDAARSAGSTEELASLAAHQMKRVTGFGRCLVYSFDADGHGCVLAENADAGYDSYAGHMFPATDIPAQARELYRVNHIRVIPDALYVPVPVARADGRTGDPIDLSFAQLRSISPVHVEFMRNMGTMASMSVSIIVRGRLWGLISCHNHEALGIDFRKRLVCEHIGELLSMLIEGLEASMDMAMRHEQRGLTMQIVSHLGSSDATLHNLTDAPDLLLNLTGAQGAAVVFEGYCWTIGITPNRDHVVTLAKWVSEKNAEIYHTDHLSGTGAPDLPDLEHAAGLLAISLSRAHRHVVLWFRTERPRSVLWAGQPETKIDQSGKLHPRSSFRSWEEIVHGRSAPWTTSEIGGAAELRWALLEIVLQRVRERVDAAGKLGRATVAREAAEHSDSAKTRFLAVLSHELRTPLASISYAAKLLDRVAKVPAEYQTLVPMIQRNVAVEARLVDDLFDMSAIESGKLHLALQPVDMHLIITQVVEALTTAAADKGLTLTVTSVSGEALVQADPVRMQQVLWNILRNAVKFTPRDGVIELRSQLADGEVVVSCKDSGVGIDASVIDNIFTAFVQGEDDTHHQFGGLGLGLAIAAGIVHGHAGTISVESEGLGRGATFVLRLPSP